MQGGLSLADYDQYSPLAGMPAWSVTEVPRDSTGIASEFQDGGHANSGNADLGAGRRFQALAAAYGAGSAVAFGWVRDHAGGPVQVIVAGPGLVAGPASVGSGAVSGLKRASEAGEGVTLVLPAGARAVPVDPGNPAAARLGPAFGALPCWTLIPVVADGLLADGGPAAGPGMTASLEDGLLAAWAGEFGWLVVAEPLPGAEITALAGEASRAQLFAQRNDSPRSQLAMRRAGARHEELRRAMATGMWRIRLLAGGSTPHAAGQVAGLLCASLSLDGLPYALTRAPGRGALKEFLEPGGSPGGGSRPAGARAGQPQRDQGEGPDDPQPEFPAVGSTRLLAALARPPEREVPGIRFTLRPEFDVTPETGKPGGAGQDGGTARSVIGGEASRAVRLGTVLDWGRSPAGEITIPRESLNRHVLVCGATGAGKSQTVRHLLESATAGGVPWLVIEPAKAEYRLMAARLRDAAPVVVIRPGDLAVPPAGISPLEPAAGPDGTRFPLQAHADMLRALFLAAFAAEEPFPQVLAAALARCYEQAGWDLVTGGPRIPGAAPAYPGLRDLQDAALAVVEDIGYGREVTDNVRGFIAVRIGSLRLGTTGRFLDGGCPLDVGRLLASNVVLEIEDCGDDADKAFLTGAVLIRLTQYLRLRQQSAPPAAGGLRHLTVIEEAHRLLRQPPPGTGNGPAAHAVEMLAGLLAEVRAYGEGLVIAEQIPSKLIPDVIKNTAVKVVHRLPASDDRDTVGATMNLTPAQSRYLVTLVPGEAAVHADGMDYPVLARMPDGTAREATPVSPASPAGLAGVRSAACPPSCFQAPCPLGLIRAAHGTLARDPRIALWAELAVAGHLTGWPVPLPSRDAMAADILAVDPRLRDCAIAHAVDDAVAARVPAITGTPATAAATGSAVLGVPALAAHVAAAMRAALGDGPWPCQRDEPQWLAPAWQWERLLAILESWERDHPGSGPHPDTPAWQALLGRRIPGITCAQQATAVWSWHARAQRDPRAITGTTFGHRTPSVIEQATGARVTDPDWDAQLALALADFTIDGPPWPATLLRQPQDETAPQ
jgi:hypothetical protein